MTAKHEENLQNQTQVKENQHDDSSNSGRSQASYDQAFTGYEQAYGVAPGGVPGFGAMPGIDNPINWLQAYNTAENTLRATRQVAEIEKLMRQQQAAPAVEVPQQQPRSTPLGGVSEFGLGLARAVVRGGRGSSSSRAQESRDDELLSILVAFNAMRQEIVQDVMTQVILAIRTNPDLFQVQGDKG